MNELWEHKNSERLAAIITCMYVNGAYGQTNEILSNMETKLFLVLHVDHKPLNIKTTQWNRLRNVNAIVLFIQKKRSSAACVCLQPSLHLTNMAAMLARRSNELKRSMMRLCIYVCVMANFLIFLF